MKLLGPEPARYADPPAMAVNPVVLALVAALRDVEQQRTRGTVRTPSKARRPAA
jgi:hypothetical protein